MQRSIRRFFRTHHDFINGQTGGLERGKVWWITGTGPVGRSDLVWFSLDLMINGLLPKGGRTGVVCYDENPQALAQFIPVVNKDLGVLLDSSNVAMAHPGDTSNDDTRVILFDLGRGEKFDIASLTTDFNLDGLLLIGYFFRDNESQPSSVEQLARDTDICILVNPWITWNFWRDDPEDPETELAEKESKLRDTELMSGRRDRLELSPLWTSPQFNGFAGFRFGEQKLKSIAAGQWNLRIHQGDRPGAVDVTLNSTSVEIVTGEEPSEQTEEIIAFTSPRFRS